MDVKIAPDWKELLAPEFEKPYFAQLTDFVRQEYATHRIFPRGSNIFRAFDKCPFERLKVVIIGQDPYHGPGQANGLCFSVSDGIPFPPSLQNIFKEVSDDTGPTRPPRTPDAAGRPSPTPSCGPSPSANKGSSTCSGAATPSVRGPLPTPRATSF